MSGTIDMEEDKDIESAMQSFIYLIIVPNPLKRNVQLIFDIDDIKITMNRDRFLSTMDKLVDKDMYYILEQVCLEYGTPYLFDKSKNTVRRLNIVSDPEAKVVYQLKDEIDKSKKSDDLNDLAISEFLEKCNVAARPDRKKADYIKRYNRFTFTNI